MGKNRGLLRTNNVSKKTVPLTKTELRLENFLERQTRTIKQLD